MKVGFTCSTFDLLHAGHVQMLRDAKSVCDYLIVGLQTDPTIDRKEKNKPVQEYEERKKAARNRIRELLLLISKWDETELDKQISVGNHGKTNYDPENIDNVKYFSQDEIACISFHLLELQDKVVTDRAVPDELIQKMINVLNEWQKAQLSKVF